MRFLDDMLAVFVSGRIPSIVIQFGMSPFVYDISVFAEILVCMLLDVFFFKLLDCYRLESAFHYALCRTVFLDEIPEKRMHLVRRMRYVFRVIVRIITCRKPAVRQEHVFFFAILQLVEEIQLAQPRHYRGIEFHRPAEICRYLGRYCRHMRIDFGFYPIEFSL